MPWLPLWVPNAWGPLCSQYPFDPYSFTHVHHGLLAYLLWGGHGLWRFLLCVACEVAWEAVENTPWVISKFREGGASPNYQGDSIMNNIGDVISCSLGYILSMILPWQMMLGYFITSELMLVLMVRDSGILICIQMVFNIEAINKWQAVIKAKEENKAKEAQKDEKEE